MKTNTLYIKNIVALFAFAIFILMLAVPVAYAQADTTPPADVENVKAVAGNAEVKLSWNVATDDTLVKGYKIYYGTTPVQEDGDVYEFEPLDVGNVITYTMKELTNGTTYYFAVTAYDEVANESINYSVEVSATPSATASDTKAPTVTGAESISKNSVVVSFSEAIQLPSMDATSAFSIVEDGSGIELGIQTVVMNPEDITDKSVSIVTSDQKPETNYIVTAGIQIKDLSGNPIESGTSDTAVFAGTDTDPLAGDKEAGSDSGQDDTEGPIMIKLNVPDNETVLVEFDEPVVLPENPEDGFFISIEEDLEEILEITGASLSADKMVVTLNTAGREARNYNLIVLETVKDLEGNLSDVTSNATVFFGQATDSTEKGSDTETEAGEVDESVGEDVEAGMEDSGEGVSSPEDAPEDVTNLTAKLLEGMIVSLSWTPSLNTMGDLANYVVYKSLDGKIYEDGVVLASDVEDYKISGLLEGSKYWFKIAARDGEGNESLGKVTSFVLPATGPEMAFVVAGALGLGRMLKRRRKKVIRKV